MKKYMREMCKAVAFVLGSALFTFAAVPVMEMALTSYDCRLIIEGFVCYMVILWFGEKMYPKRRKRKREKPYR